MEWDFTNIGSTDDAEIAADMAYDMVQDGVQQGTIRADQAGQIDYSTVKTGATAIATHDKVRATSAKIDNRAPTDGLFTGAPMYGDRRAEYFNASSFYRPVVGDDGSIGNFANLRRPDSIRLFEMAFGAAGKKLHGTLREGGVLTREQGEHLLATQARSSEDHLKGLRADSNDGMRLNEPAHFEVLRITLSNGGRLPEHLVGAYKSGDMTAFSKALILNPNGEGGQPLDATTIRERILTALSFTDAATLKAQGVFNPDKVAAQLAGQSEQYKALSGKTVLPFSTKGVTMTSGFGMRNHPTLKVQKMHNGLDFSGMKKNDPIHTIENGTIHKVGTNSSFGNFVMVRRGDGTFVLYAHLNSTTAQEGQKVSAGDVLGGAGTTGRSTGVHLHIEHWADAGGTKRLDPSKLFPKGMLKALTRHRKR